MRLAPEDSIDLAVIKAALPAEPRVGRGPWGGPIRAYERIERRLFELAVLESIPIEPRPAPSDDIITVAAALPALHMLGPTCFCKSCTAHAALGRLAGLVLGGKA